MAELSRFSLVDNPATLTADLYFCVKATNVGYVVIAIYTSVMLFALFCNFTSNH